MSSNVPRTKSFERMRTRYHAGIKEVRKGADPYQVFWWVLFPSERVERAVREKQERRAA